MHESYKIKSKTGSRLIVGGVVNATVLSITKATNLTDQEHNYIYFIPKGSRSARLARRQSGNTDPNLKYAPGKLSILAKSHLLVLAFARDVIMSSIQG